MKLKKGLVINEDELPELTDEEYNEWYNSSWLSEGITGVRLGWGVVFGSTELQDVGNNV